MIELWAGAIVATIAGCIYAAWGPKVLLGTIAALPVVGVLWLNATSGDEQHEFSTRCFDMPGTTMWGNYENPTDCRKAGGVPYADRYPDLYKRYSK